MSAPKRSEPLLGVCPIGKFVFSHEDAIRQKKALFKQLDTWKIRYCDLESVLPDGIVRDQKHVEPVVKYFRKKGIDALFVPHCNFGTEGAVGIIARELNVPTLLWGPRDESPLSDGSRLRDTLCGMFATSSVLRKLGVQFSYIENCRIGDPAFCKGLDAFLRGVHAANVLRRGTRIGHIGQRIDFFWTTIVNAAELLERFKVEIEPLDMMTFIRHVKDRVARNHSKYEREAREWDRRLIIEGFAGPEPLCHILAVRDQMLALAEDYGLEGLAGQDSKSVIEEIGAFCCFAGSLASEQLAVGIESDIHGTLSNILLNRITYQTQPSFLTEFTIRHPTNDNGILLWHAGAPLSMCHPDEKPRLGKHWCKQSAV